MKNYQSIIRAESKFLKKLKKKEDTSNSWKFKITEYSSDENGELIGKDSEGLSLHNSGDKNSEMKSFFEDGIQSLNSDLAFNLLKLHSEFIRIDSQGKFRIINLERVDALPEDLALLPEGCYPFLIDDLNNIFIVNREVGRIDILIASADADIGLYSAGRFCLNESGLVTSLDNFSDFSSEKESNKNFLIFVEQFGIKLSSSIESGLGLVGVNIKYGDLFDSLFNKVTFKKYDSPPIRIEKSVMPGGGRITAQLTGRKFVQWEGISRFSGKIKARAEKVYSAVFTNKNGTHKVHIGSDLTAKSKVKGTSFFSFKKERGVKKNVLKDMDEVQYAWGTWTTKNGQVETKSFKTIPTLLFLNRSFHRNF